MKALVVGAGIMGLSAAWAIARRGHQVSVYEQGQIPNPLASSFDQHRLIRYPYGHMEGYARMVGEAYAAWDLLWKDLDQCLYVETGTLTLAGENATWAEDSAAILARLDIPMQKLTPEEVAREYPFLNVNTLDWALYTPTGGVLLAQSILEALAEYLKNGGVELYPHTAVRQVDPLRGHLLLEDGTEVGGDVLIVAAGPWVPNLVPQMRDRVTPSRQVLLYLDPPPDLAPLWQRSPMILDIAVEQGFYAVPPVAGRGLKVGNHSFSLWGDPGRDRDVTPEEVAALEKLCQRGLKNFARYPSAKAKTCFYTVAPDERFIVETVERTWILSGFSGHGFKFGAVVGNAVASAIEGKRDPAEVSRWASGNFD